MNKSKKIADTPFSRDNGKRGNPDFKRLEAEVFGRVQGIGFRAFIASGFRDKLTGKIWNTDTGTVKVIAEGEEAVLQKLLSVLNKGPMFAKVEKVDYSWGQSTGKYGKFDVVISGDILSDKVSAVKDLLRKIAYNTNT